MSKKLGSVRKVALAAASIAALAAGGLAIGAPAQAAAPTPSCSYGKSADLHTGWAVCTIKQPSTGTFRVAVQFCTTSNCNWAYGKYVFFGDKSSKTSSGAYVNAIGYDLGPAGGFVRIDQ